MANFIRATIFICMITLCLAWKWKPEKGTLEEFNKNHGISENTWQKVKVKLLKLKARAMSDSGITMDAVASSHSPSNAGDSSDVVTDPQRLDNCLLLTEPQVDQLLKEGNDKKRRRKRSMDKNSFFKWDSDKPIPWRFDGNHTHSEQVIIRKAFKVWEENTCVRFRELQTDEKANGHSVLVTRNGLGCFSFLGKVNVFPQQLNLQSSCLKEYGTPIHEIGHVLGLWHEQQRSDRDEHVEVIWKNVGYLAGQFFKTSTNNQDLPYNFGSIMHYGPKSGTKNGGLTMQAHDPFYQRNMGQRVELSFGDAKSINFAYCKEKCPYRLSDKCQRHGYQDPNDCSRCRCPYGFAGKYCQLVAESVNVDDGCGGRIVLNKGDTKVIESPGYSTLKHYNNRQQCNWLFVAPEGYKVTMNFVDDFGIYCHNEYQCYHWLEVRHSEDLGNQGPRLCCYRRPTEVITSETSEMMLLFKSNYDVAWKTAKQGFRARLQVVKDDSYTGHTEKKYTKTTTTTTTTTTTPKPSPTTTTSPKIVCDSFDLTFAVDVGGGLSSGKNWRDLKDLVSGVTDRLLPRDHEARRVCNVRLSITTFTGTTEVDSELEDFEDVDEFMEKLDHVEDNMRRGRSDIRGALELVDNRKLSSSTSGNRKQFVVLLTDGESPASHKRQCVRTAESLKRNEVHVLSISVGDHTDRQQLRYLGFAEIHASNFRSISGSYFVDNVADEIKGQVRRELKKALTTTTTPRTTTRKTTTTTTKNPVDNSVILFKCSFEKHGKPDICGIRQSIRDDFNWTINKGKTPSTETGPDLAYDGKYYIYIEASDKQPDDSAKLILPRLGRSGAHCLRFAYHMYGFHINSLEVITESDREDRISKFWYRKGNHNTPWWTQGVTIHLQDADDRISFIASRGEEYSGDIAIDDISVTTGTCPHGY